MDDMDFEKSDDIAKLKYVLLQLVKTAKQRQAEIEALKESIESLRGECEEYRHSQDFRDWDAKYGDKLKGYNNTFAVTEKNPDYDFSKEVFDSYSAMSDEELKNTTADEFVDKAIEKADEYIALIKDKLNLPEGAKVEITETDEGAKITANAEVETPEKETANPEAEKSEADEIEKAAEAERAKMGAKTEEEQKKEDKE